MQGKLVPWPRAGGFFNNLLYNHKHYIFRNKLIKRFSTSDSVNFWRVFFSDYSVIIQILVTLQSPSPYQISKCSRLHQSEQDILLKADMNSNSGPLDPRAATFHAEPFCTCVHCKFSQNLSRGDGCDVELNELVHSTTLTRPTGFSFNDAKIDFRQPRLVGALCIHISAIYTKHFYRPPILRWARPVLMSKVDNWDDFGTVSGVHVAGRPLVKYFPR